MFFFFFKDVKYWKPHKTVKSNLISSLKRAESANWKYFDLNNVSHTQHEVDHTTQVSSTHAHFLTLHVTFKAFHQ